jgi:trk system potassium uptake protein TrkA
MKVVIVGAGFTGIQLAKRLINGKNDVVLIDNDEETVRHVSNRLDCDVVNADGNNLVTLEEAGIDKADALICVTSSDEVNMITCSLVDAVYPDLLKIARVRNYAYYINSASAVEKHAGTFTGKHRPLYGIDYMVHPDVEAAQAIVNAVERGAITDSIQFEDSDYELVRISVERGSVFDGARICDIRNFTDKKLVIAYVESNGETFLPNGETIIHDGACIGILMNRADLTEFLGLCGSQLKVVKKIALVGAGRIGTIVAEKLIKPKRNLLSKLFGARNKEVQDFVIIDSNETNAKNASEKFKDVKVFKADVTEEGFVQEEGIDKFDLVICATSNHEMNIVMAAYIESLGVKNSIALVSNGQFIDVARKIGIEVAVPLRDSVVDSIISHLYGKTVTGIHTVNGSELEILEVTISQEAEVNGKALKEIAESGKFLVLLVKKVGSEEFLIPDGNTVLKTKDKVVLITNSDDNQHVMEKFGTIE